jgi:2-phosphoglycerate kinase
MYQKLPVSIAYNNVLINNPVLVYILLATILEKVHECTPLLTAEERTTTNETECIRRELFEQYIQNVLMEWHYQLPRFHQRLAWSVRNRERGICLLLGGTSGCGKSTLASLLASR